MSGEHKAGSDDSARATWSIGEWCPLANISRTGEFLLPEAMKPKSIQIGRRRIIIESPGSWVARIARMQAEVTA